MLNILQQVDEWIKNFLIECIKANLNGMFNDVNNKVGEIAGEVSKTPAAWNGDIFSMIQSLSDTVIVPIAGMILTFVLCYELISLIVERNNLHDLDSWVFFKWIFKAFVAVYLVTHTFDITMAVFDVGQYVVNQSAGLIGDNANLDFTTIVGDFEPRLKAMGMGELFGLLLESTLVKITVPALRICVMLVLYGRMIEIFIYCSVGAIPFATMTNREWGQIGQNYLRGLVALGLQGFFIMVCVAIYTVLVRGIGTEENVHLAIWTCTGYTVLLCFSLFKTGSISKSLFNAH